MNIAQTIFAVAVIYATFVVGISYANGGRHPCGRWYFTLTWILNGILYPLLAGIGIFVLWGLYTALGTLP